VIRLILFLLLVGIPIAEIAVLLTVGSVIGVLPTIAIIILTAAIGTVLLKRQGVSALRRLQDDVRQDRIPAEAIGHAVTVAIAGVLLLTPGFITDAVGFALFVPAVRRALWRRIARSVTVVHAARPGPGRGPQPRGRTIDLDEEDYRRADPDSPWNDRPDR